MRPKMITMHIDPDKIREVIGSGGKTIQKICADTGAKIDIEDDGSVFISAVDAAACDAAKKMIDDICFVPEVGKLVLRQGRPHHPDWRLRRAGPGQGRHDSHLQAGKPPRREG